MRSNVTAKIKLAPRRTLVTLSIVVLALVGFAIYSFTLDDSATLKTDRGSRQLAVVDTEEARSKGLGDRANLPLGQGMLFVYDSPAIHCFWMKDMKFSIDMIWVSADRTVVHIERNVAPDTYPKSFCPEGAAQYVIELNGGQAAELGIDVGDRLRF